jgi:signal peptidase I
MANRTSSRTSSGFAETIKTLVYAIVIALFIRTFFYEPFSIPSASMVPTLLIGDYLFVSKFSYGYSRWSFPFGVPLIPGPGRLWFRAPHRGDVVVFKLTCDFSQLPAQEQTFHKRDCDPSTDFIKRIVGLPGDHLQMKDGVLNINGTPVKLQRLTDYYYAEPFSRGGDTGCRAGNYPQYRETLPGGVDHILIKTCGPPQFDNTQIFTVPPDHYFMMGDNRDDSADSRDPTSGVGYVPAENLVGHAQFMFFSTDGYAAWWEPWKWPFTVRYDRLLMAIH